MFNTAVIGAAGYTGIELVRYILRHPKLGLISASSDSDAGLPLASLYPALNGRHFTGDIFVPHSKVVKQAQSKELDLVFLAVPHTAAMPLVYSLLEAQVCVIDLSADFRLRDASVYEKWYGHTHTHPELLKAAAYGLPELFREDLLALAKKRQKNIALAKTDLEINYVEKNKLNKNLSQAVADNGVLVANPGCYPTATALAIAPALRSGCVDTNASAPIVVNAISGVSGAGRKATAITQFCTVDSNLNAYGATTHRHTPEIQQSLSRLAGRNDIGVVFTPHLAPLKRGMVSTVVAALNDDIDANELQKIYEKTYNNEVFVSVLPLGTMPQSAAVAGTNNAHVGIAICNETRSLVASCAIDNLGKGAAAQAIQNANIILGLEETIGLCEIGAIV
ncbi:MAG: N-acetyl-gamma-glutamyl-phosphate reductase [Coriobacteriales bacterium]|jgi:N-acetyl-gamma-glutamyl-phosphate reductase|nr:N-acetyl-gamma-glutamyl-phosphate reductase [Coriobacteriales bacterium]